MHFGFATKHGLAAFDRVADRIRKHFVIERPGQEFESSAFHCIYSNACIATGGEENNWHLRTLSGETPLEFEAIHIWKADINDEAARSRESRACEKVMSRCVDLQLQTG